MDRLLKRLEPVILTSRIGPIRARLQRQLNLEVPGLRRFPAHRVRILSAHARRIAPDASVVVMPAVVERRQI